MLTPTVVAGFVLATTGVIAQKIRSALFATTPVRPVFLSLFIWFSEKIYCLKFLLFDISQ